MDNFRKLVASDEENNNNQSSIQMPKMDDGCDMCPKMTYQQRIIGFVCCFATGYLLSFIVRLIYLCHLNNTGRSHAL